MQTIKKVIKYPENLPLKAAVTASGISIRQLAKLIGVTPQIISYTINGHYKGTSHVTKINKIINNSQNGLGLLHGVN